MPASKCNSWFITLSTRVFEEIDLVVVEQWSKNYPNYHVVKELGKSGGHPHIHAVLSGDKIESQDVVRKRWKKCIRADPSDLKNGVTVVPVTDKDQLIGGYLSKEQDAEVLWTTVDSHVLEKLRETYAHQTKVIQGASKIRNIPLTCLADRIISFAKENELPIRYRADLQTIISQMYKRGLRFTAGLSRLRIVWAEICLLSDVQSGQVTVDDLIGF